MTQPLDLSHLRRVAEAAPKGEFKATYEALHGAPVVRYDGLYFCQTRTDEVGIAIAAHVLAFNPCTALALIDRIEELEKGYGAIDNLITALDELRIKSTHPNRGQERRNVWAALAEVRARRDGKRNGND